MKIQALRALNTDGVKDFYRSMPKVTSGHYPQNFCNICNFIMVICYRERNDGLISVRGFLSGFN